MKALGVLGIVLAGVLAYFIGRSDGTAAADEPALERGRLAAIANAHTWRTKYEILHDDSVDRERELTRITTAQAVSRASADSVGQLRDALSSTLPALLDTRDSVNALLQLVRLDAQQIAHLEAALAQADQRFSFTERDRDRWKALADAAAPAMLALEEALNLEHQARVCYLVHVGPAKIKCPSRKATAAIAVAVTLTTEAVVRTVAH